MTSERITQHTISFGSEDMWRLSLARAGRVMNICLYRGDKSTPTHRVEMPADNFRAICHDLLTRYDEYDDAMAFVEREFGG